jgi:fatty acid/phospholipid biosynthesis enzyme
MGGDYAPKNVVVGAIQAAKENSDFELLLVGKKDEILKIIKDNNFEISDYSVKNEKKFIYSRRCQPGKR